MSKDETNEPPPEHNDSHLRSLVKGLTWRFTATTTTFLITWVLIRLFGKDEAMRSEAVSLAASVAGVEFVLKLVVYYLHERIWVLVPMR